MCLLTFIYIEGNKDLILCSNRDENLVRPTLRGRLHPLDGGATGAEAAYFPQDREAGGTWIALSNINARFAVVLNFHDWRYPSEDIAGCQASGSEAGTVQSRGLIVLEFIKAPAEVTAKQFAHQILEQRHGSYSLLVGDSIDGCYYVSNRDSESPVFMAPGKVHSVSNGKRSDVWPKVTLSLNRVRNVLAEYDVCLEGAGGGVVVRGQQPRPMGEARALAHSLREVLWDDTPLPDATHGTTSESFMNRSAIFVKPTCLYDPATSQSVNFGTRTTTIAVSAASHRDAEGCCEHGTTDGADLFSDMLIFESDRDEASGLWTDSETILPRFARLAEHTNTYM
jgi:uncharacterized protein with NRDE domain